MKPQFLHCLAISLMLFLGYNLSAKENLNCYQKVSGKVSDGLTNQSLADARIVLYDVFKEDYYNLKEGNEFIHQNTKIHKKEVFTSNSDGLFNIDASCERFYHLIVTINGFESESKSFSTFELVEEGLVLDYELKNIEIFKDSKDRFQLQLEPIKFEINSSNIDSESKKELNKVVLLLNKYLDLKIEIGVHSSSLGSDAFNLKLTASRANTINDYLASFDWDNKERVIAVGYGAKQILNECVKGVKCRPNKHNENKRVEFVLKSDYKPTSDFEYLNRNTSSN